MSIEDKITVKLLYRGADNKCQSRSVEGALELGFTFERIHSLSHRQISQLAHLNPHRNTCTKKTDVACRVQHSQVLSLACVNYSSLSLGNLILLLIKT